MNFLSHFYTDQHRDDSYYVLGLVLPDLVRNAGISQKFRFQVSDFSDISYRALAEGWQKHESVDRIFHGHSFFKSQTHHLFLEMQSYLPSTVIRYSFLSHIAFELLLDHCLVVQNRVDVSAFYTHLQQVDEQVLYAFLRACAVPTEALLRFQIFYEGFCKQEYLYSYHDLNQVSYALLQICRRVWRDLEITDRFQTQLTGVLSTYPKRWGDSYLGVLQLP